MPIYKHKNYSVNVGNDCTIVVQRRDWLSKYLAAIHAGDTTQVNGQVIVLHAWWVRKHGEKEDSR